MPPAIDRQAFHHSLTVLEIQRSFFKISLFEFTRGIFSGINRIDNALKLCNFFRVRIKKLRDELKHLLILTH